MSTTTSNLGLFKYDVSADRDTAFSINTALNNNWDKIDDKVIQKTGDTFVGDVTISKSKPSLTLDDANTADSNYSYIAFKSAKADISESTAPASNKNIWAIYGYDKNNNMTSRIANLHNTGNNVYTGIETYRQVNGESINSYVRIGVQSDGTPYVYTITPSESSNNASIATTEWVNDKIDAIPMVDPTDVCVSKIGDTMTGDLTIAKSIPKTVLQDTGITKGTTPSSNKSSSFSYVDSAGNNTSAIISGYTTSGVIYTGLYAYQPVSGSSTSSSIRIYYPKTGDPYTFAPPSDTKNSILTTTGISKAQNGYLKLGNGVIIQWGKAGTGGKHCEVVLSLSFTATTYPVTMTPYHTASSGNGISYGWTVDVSEKSTSKFYFSHYSGYDNWYWHAIGY